MMGGDKSIPGHNLPETCDNMSFDLNQIDPEENLIPEICDSFDLNQLAPEEYITSETCDNMSFDLNQLIPEPDLLPDLNTTDMSSSISNTYRQGLYYPRWNMDELLSHAYKTGLSESFMSHQINNIDTKKGSSMFYDKRGVDIRFRENCEDIKRLGIGNDTEKSGNGINCDVRIGEPNRAIFPRSNSPGHHLFDAYGSDAFLGSSQFQTLQNPLPDKLRNYTTCSLESPWTISHEIDNLGTNWGHQKGFGGELETTSVLFSSSSASGLSGFGNKISPTLGLESKRSSLITPQQNRDQLAIPYMQNTGKVPAFLSVATHIENQSPRRRELRRDGQLISQSKDNWMSLASDTLGVSSHKRSLDQPHPDPRIQSKKIKVSSPIMPPVTNQSPAAPRGSPGKKTISNPIIPSPPTAPWAQRSRETVPFPALEPVRSPSLSAPFPTPRALPIVETISQTNMPAPKGQYTNISVPSPIISPSVINSPIVAPTHKPAHASFVAPTIPPPLAKMRAPSPVVRPLPKSVEPDSPVPDSPPHIKWQDPDGFPPPLGEKCLICKRDLLFTAEGPVFQPDLPPEAAVLPCGHTFHDHCLHIITPQDQSTNPPCIPCALGEI